jgi:outer membrane protein assembly factor BamB
MAQRIRRIVLLLATVLASSGVLPAWAHGAVPLAGPAASAASTLKVKPASAITGERVKLRGTLAPKAARPVTLQRKKGAGWKRVTAGRTSATGTFVFKIAAPRRTTTYRVLAASARSGSGVLPRIVTPSRILRIQPQSGSLSLPSDVTVGAGAVAKASFAPPRTGRTVTLERQAGTGWTTEQTGTEAADGSASFAVSTSTTGSRTYRVVAAARRGAPSVASAARTIVVETGQAPDTTPPGTVSFLTIEDTTTSSITLSWSNPADDDYRGAMVRRAAGSTPPASPSSGTLVTDLLAPGDFLVDTGLTAGATYSYAVFAHDEVPNYAPAATITGSTQPGGDGGDVQPPGPVSGLALSGTTTTSLTLTWTNPGDGDYAGAMIRRAVGPTPPANAAAGTLVVDKATPGTSHTDTGLTAGTTYSYAVFAHDAVPNYADSATLTAATSLVPDTTPPGPITGLTVGSATSGSLTLTWTNPGAPDYAGAMIRRAVGPTPPANAAAGTLVVDKAAPGTSHVDTGLAPGTTYSYAVFAHDAVPNYAAAATSSAATTAATSSDWAQTSHDAAHTSWSPDETVLSPGNAATVGEEWNVVGGGRPAIYAGVLYVSDTEPLAGKGRLTAYDLSTGGQLWQVETGACNGSVSVNATLVVVGCGEPRAYLRTGAHTLVWDVHDTDPGAAMQYFQLTADRLVAWTSTKAAVYRLSDAQRVWQQLLPSGAVSVNDVAVSGTTVVVAYNDRLRGLSLTTGAQTWADTGVVSSTLVAANGFVYTNHEGAVKRYAVADGVPGWTALPAGNVYRVLGADADTVYVWEAVFDYSAPYPSIVHALRQSDGTQRWQADVPSRIGTLAITGDLVWYTSTGIYSQEHASDLVALDRITGDQVSATHFDDNMYGADNVAFGGGKVVFNEGGSFGNPVPAALRVFGVAGPLPVIGSAALPLAHVGTAYSTSFAASPSGATWTIRSGSLPAGLTLAPDGTVSGTPTAPGLSRVTVRATGTNGRYTERSYPLQVLADAAWSWGQAGHDATRNPFVPGSSILGLATAPSFGYRWKTAAPGAAISGGNLDAMWANDRVYAVQWDGTLSAWDTTGSTANRTPVWSKLPTAPGVTFVGQPSLAGDRLIVRDSTNHVQGIRLTDGADLWTTATAVTSNNGFQSMLVSGTTFFTTGDGDAIVAYSTTDGTAKWGGASTGVNGTWYAESTDGTRVFAQDDCELYAFNVANGSTAWHTPIVTDSGGGCASVYSNNGPPLVVDGLVYAVTTQGRLVADAVTGAPVLKIPSSNFQQGQGVVAGGLWIFDNDTKTVAVDTSTGQVAWSVPDNGDDIRYSVVGDLVLAVGQYSMVGLSRVDGSQVWDAGDIGGSVGNATPVVAADRVLLLSQEGVRAFGPLLD